MTTKIRRLVSKKKIRFEEDDFDLDLSYILPDRLIAMGYPAENLEMVYRNPLDDVVKFLEQKHANHYKVFNLCSERAYDAQKIRGPVERYPFDDHKPPPFTLIDKCCASIHQWLEAHPKNCAAVHCKAGKGRTGLIICCYLMYSDPKRSATEAMELYAKQRTKNSKGVTIPSQKRYIYYYEYFLRKHLEYKRTILRLHRIEIRGFPSVPLVGNSLVVQATVHQMDDLSQMSHIHTSVTHHLKRNENVTNLNLDDDVQVKGDIQITLKRANFLSKNKLFSIWLNTFFIIQGNSEYWMQNSSHNMPALGDCVQLSKESGSHWDSLPPTNSGFSPKSSIMKVLDSSNDSLPSSITSSTTPSNHQLRPERGKEDISSVTRRPMRNTETSCKNPAHRSTIPSVSVTNPVTHSPLIINTTHTVKRQGEHLYTASFSLAQLDGAIKKYSKSYPNDFQVRLTFSCLGCNRCLVGSLIPSHINPTLPQPPKKSFQSHDATGLFGATSNVCVGDVNNGVNNNLLSPPNARRQGSHHSSFRYAHDAIDAPNSNSTTAATNFYSSNGSSLSNKECHRGRTKENAPKLDRSLLAVSGSKQRHRSVERAMGNITISHSQENSLEVEYRNHSGSSPPFTYNRDSIIHRSSLALPNTADNFSDSGSVTDVNSVHTTLLRTGSDSLTQQNGDRLWKRMSRASRMLQAAQESVAEQNALPICVVSERSSTTPPRPTTYTTKSSDSSATVSPSQGLQSRLSTTVECESGDSDLEMTDTVTLQTSKRQPTPNNMVEMRKPKLEQIHSTYL